MTVLEAIQLSTEYLIKKGIESPRVNAELLLADILNCKRLDLYLAFDKPLKENEIIKYREYLKRRSAFEPLQYITGTVEFFGLPFIVNSSVLIPRPETEILVETIINKFEKNNSYSILDIGTGSGIIPITLAAHFPTASLTALDISNDAISTAIENAKKNNVKNRIHFINVDIRNGSFSSNEKYDIVVSNPPYVSLDEYIKLQPEIVKYEPKDAVTDNKDGLLFYKIIIEKSGELLNKNGYLFFELGKEQFNEVKDLMLQYNFSDINIIKDYQNIERVIYGVKT